MLLRVSNIFRMKFLSLIGLLSVSVLAAVLVSASPTLSQAQQPSPGVPAATSPTASPGLGGAVGTAASAFGAQTQQSGLNIVVLDPGHGGIDSGARGTGGIRESEIVLDFAVQVRRALELQGFQVVQTRQGNENPSFDDRSTLANAQRGAVFVTLHIASTGLPGTARVYTMPESAATVPTGGILSWDHAQAPYITLSRKFGDAVQGQLAQRFKGSPNNAQSAAI